jgi:hypothetical protein
MTRDEKQENPRSELRETHETQVDRPLGDFINLPANRNRLHLQAGYDKKPSQLIKRKVGMSEGNAPGA